jgi:hypothetical protein
MLVLMMIRSLLLCLLFVASTLSFAFPRQGLLCVKKGFGRMSGLTVCNGRRRKPIHINEWAKHVDGYLVQKNGVISLEEKPKKRVSIAEAMSRPPTNRIALLVKGGTKGNNVGSCHLAHFIRMVLQHKSINCTVLPFATCDRPQWLIGPCPNEEPCLLYDGSPYYDPYIIARHLSFFHPDPEVDADDSTANELCDQLYQHLRDMIIAENEENQMEAKNSLVKSLSGLDTFVMSTGRKVSMSCVDMFLI